MFNQVCTTFASALTYADDLGLRAKSGFVQYQRQSLFGGGYGHPSRRRDCRSAAPPSPFSRCFNAYAAGVSGT